jgi:hypothetical protein
VAVSGNSFFIPDRLYKALPQAYCNVFNGMMGVNVQITFGFDLQINFAVLAEVREHMVQETYAGIDLVFAEAVQIKPAVDVCFFCLSVNFSGSLFHNNVLILTGFLSGPR